MKEVMSKPVNIQKCRPGEAPEAGGRLTYVRLGKEASVAAAG